MGWCKCCVKCAARGVRVESSPGQKKSVSPYKGKKQAKISYLKVNFHWNKLQSRSLKVILRQCGGSKFQNFPLSANHGAASGRHYIHLPLLILWKEGPALPS